VSEFTEAVFRPRTMLRALLEHGVEFVVIGGVAVQTHGHVRVTRDLDIVPAPDLLNLSRLSDALAALSAAADPHVLKRAPHLHLMTDAGPLDLLHAGLAPGLPKTYEELRGRAVELDWEGHIVAVAGLDDLIRMKRIAGRDVDLSDIGALTRTDEQLQDEAGEST
jgi:predicted nucleotidyltransferase